MSSTAACQRNILEYLRSTPIWTKMCPEAILKLLADQRISVLDGPCASAKSAKMTMKLMAMRHVATFTPPHNSEANQSALGVHKDDGQRLKGHI
ncbi:hypothetical protein TWF696_002485 [Orbilia brochopaga]|uniref:Uncharacterized protein n=1 Tax=Orbilia brochopaga TaxID=3140254 RepID=A0AAV9U4F9_9PEZI